MAIFHQLACFLAFSIVVFAATLPHSPSLDILSNTSSITDSLSPFLPPSTNLSADNKIHITCDANTYGQNLKVISCKKIFQYITKDDKQIVFGDRASLAPRELPLPYRLQSNDGVCYLELILDDDAQSGHVSSTEFGRAAFTMFQQCVVKYGYGGIASQMGGDNKLKAVMSSYKPHFVCSQRPAPPWRSVVHIFADMFASKRRENFGRPKAPNVDVELPFEWGTIDARARLIVDSDGRTVRASWFEIWEAVNTVAYACVKAKGKGGKATRIGPLGNIHVELYDEHPDASQSVADSEDDSLPYTSGFNARNESTSDFPLLLASNVTVIQADDE